MAYAVKYVFTFQSVGGTTREIRILKDGYSGDPIRRALGRAPILKKQQNGPVHGTSLELYAECHVDQEFIEFYTSDPKAYRVDLYAGSMLLWQGWITPELYSEPDIAPPYDVQVVATDGVGELKLYDFAAQGMVSLRAMLTYLLGKTGLSTDVFLVSSMKAGSAGAGALLDMEANFDYLVGKTCYEALSYLLTTLHATITWWGGHWLLVRENNVTFTSGKVRYFNVAGNSALLANSVQALGRMYQDAVWPVGQLSTVIDPAKNKVVVQAPWHPVTALQNSDMTADANWNKSGVTYDSAKGAYFFARDVITPGELAQSVAFGGLRVPMRMTLSGCGTSETGSGFTGTGNGWVGLVLKFQDGDGNVYYLGVDGDGNRRWELYDSGRIPRAFEQDLLSVDTDRENADRIELDIPALAVDGGFPSGTLTVGIWGGAVYVFSAHLDVVLNKGYQDILHIDNGARGEGDDTEIAFGRVTSDVAYYQAFVQGILLNNGALITAFSDANFTTGTDYLSFISRDYARSVALPRARVEGTVSLEPSVQLPPLVFTKGGLDYWLETWSWNLYEDELQISARTLPTATLTVDSETITEAGGTASTGSSSGGASSTPVPQVAPNYFEKDGTFVTGIKLKDEFDAVRVPGLRFGNGAQDPDLYVDTIEDSQGNPQRVLRSPLPLITAGDQIVEDGEPGDPEGERLRDLEDVYHDDNSVKRYNGGAVGTSDILAYDSVLGWYAAQLGLNLSMVNGVLTVEGGGGGGTTYNSGTVEELNNGSGTVDRVWTPKVLADWLKGLGYIFAGIATPTDPAETPTPGGKVFFIAYTPGTYENFDDIVVNSGEVAFLCYSGASWVKLNSGLASASDVINLSDGALAIVPKVHSDVANRYIETAGENIGKWRSGTGIACRLYDVEGLAKITLQANASYETCWALLKSDTVELYAMADFATGETINTLSAGARITHNIPADAKYLYVFNYTSSATYLPDKVLAPFDNIGALTDWLLRPEFAALAELAEKTLEMTPSVHSDVANRYIESTAGTNFGKWRTGTSLSCRFYSVAGLSSIRIVANSTKQATYALLKSDTIVNGQLADYATGETVNTLAAGREVTITVPADAVYLYVFNYSGANVFLPSKVAAVFSGFPEFFNYLFAGATKYISAAPISNDGYVIGASGDATGKWAALTNSKSKFYDIAAVDAITITSNASYGARYAMLTSKDVNVGSMADFASGTALTILTAGETINIVRPADAKYLYIFQGTNNTTAYEPTAIVFATNDLYSAINNDFIKPTNDRITSLDEKSASNKAALLAETDLVVPNLHISVDDCISCFHDLVTDEPASIYDNAFFAQMKALHDTYGVKITICCFLNYTGAGYDSFRLSDMPNTWAAEFVAAKSWLRFAFHGSSATTFNANDITPFYDEFVSAIYGMTGDYDCIDTVICLQSFTGSLANVQRLMSAEHGAAQAFRGGWEEGGRVTYYLDQDASDFLIRHGVEVDNANNVLFFRSYPYLDDHDLADIQAEYNKYPVSRKYVEIAFHLTPSSHSVYPGAFADAQEVCDWFMNTKGYDSNFLADILR